MGNDKLAIDKMYSETGEAWRQFVSWREKIIAGYLSILAAIAIAFHAETSTEVRCILCAAAIIVSVSFWVFDLRNRDLMAACQTVAGSLEDGKGCYSALNKERIDRMRILTHGLAINILVCSVTAASISAILSYLVESVVSGSLLSWRLSPWLGFLTLTFPGITKVVAAIVFVVLFCVLLYECEELGWEQKRRFREFHETDQSKT